MSGTVSCLILDDTIYSDLLEQTRGIMTGYALVLIVLTVYFSYKKTGISFSEYVGSVFSNILPMFLIYLVLSFGVLFLYGAAEELFDLNGDGMVIVLPFTLYLIPGCIYSLNHINRQINDSLSQIVKYIINIFSICMIVMGYGYVLKLILMQIYSVAVRIMDYGFTPDRYLQKVQAGEELSELEYKRFEGAYKYQKTRVDSAIFDEQYGEAGEYIAQEKGSYEQTWEYLHGCQLVGEIDTAGYSQMNMLNQSDSYVRNNADEIIIDFSKFQFYKRETGETVEIDLSDFYERCLNYMEENPDSDKEKDSAFMKQCNRIKVDENRVFYVNHFEIDFCVTKEKGEERRKIKSVNISGILLEK